MGADDEGAVGPSPGQRWVSRTEPELGLGTILEVDGRSVVIHFSAAEATRRYAGGAPLRRVRFHPGDEVEDTDGGSLVIEEVREDGALLIYRGQGRELPEPLLADHNSFNDPSERLAAGQVDATATFDLRLRALDRQARIARSKHRGFVGGRVDLMPHQLYVAQEVAARHAPRVLLADEPGLGKTIEACLILHNMLLSGRAERVLILVPAQLVPQWVVELRRRFNLTFSVYDEARCQAIEEADPNANPFTEDQLILAGIETLAPPRRASQAVDARWDVVVVDEAHHLRWAPDAPSSEYRVVEALGAASGGLLLLTATPEQLGREAHFARLKLLDAERYPSFEAFRREPRQHREVVELAERLLAGQPLLGDSPQALRRMLAHDAAALDRDLPRLAAGDAVLGRRWADSLLDLHGPGRVMLRNTRAAIATFPPRICHLTPLAPRNDEQRVAVSQELVAELAGTPGPDLDYEDDPRVDWLLTRLADHPDEKVLLICTTTKKCLAIEAALRRRAKIHGAVFHEDLTIVQRDRNAAFFAEAGGAQVLICSEIGSEGRNFQFAQHLVLFDLPLDPDLLEQRIGRLERIGQTKDVHLHVLYLEGSAQEVLVRWMHEGVQAIDESAAAGASFLERFGGEVRGAVAAAARGELSPESLDTLIADTRRHRAEVAIALQEGRDRMIELTSFRPGASDALIAAVSAEDDDPHLEEFFVELMEHLGVYSDEFDERCYLLNPDALVTDHFPKLERGDTRVTFDRAVALARWDLEFISMDHPLVQKAFDTFLLSEEGNSAFALWEEDEPQGMLLEAVYVVETLAPLGLHIERFLESTPLRLVVDHRGEDRSGEVTPGVLADVLRDADAEWLTANRQSVQRLVATMIESAEAAASKHLPARIAAARRAATDRPDLERLRMLMRVNSHVRPEEVEHAEADVERVVHHIEGARLRLQALRLIWRGPCEDRRPHLG